MAPKLIKSKVKGKIDVKRFKLKGVEMEDNCPSCGKLWQFNDENDYLTYPVAGDEATIFAHCDCGESWDIKVTLGISISL